MKLTQNDFRFSFNDVNSVTDFFQVNFAVIDLEFVRDPERLVTLLFFAVCRFESHDFMLFLRLAKLKIKLTGLLLSPIR